jgi:hypothetical protein
VIRTPRRRRPLLPAAPAPPPSQDELRLRRRQSRSVVYTGSFSLVDEVSDIAAPLAKRVAAEPRPTAYWAEVDGLVTAVYKSVVVIVDMLAEVDASRRTAHLPVDQRGHAAKLIRDLAKAQRPARPEIGCGELVSVRGRRVWSSFVDRLRGLCAPCLTMPGRSRPVPRRLPSV